MLAYVIEKNSRCVLCGTAEWEWDPRQGGSRRAYEAVEHFCQGCYVKAAAQINDPQRNTDGITIELAPTGTRAAAERLVRADRLRGDR